MSLIRDLLKKPSTLSTASKYTVLNGVGYVVAGFLLIVWPRVVRVIFMERPFVGHEGALFRVIGMTLVVIGWFYLFGGRSGARQIIAASVIDRMVFVPVVLVPIALAGIFPHVLITFAILDPSLAIVAWVLFSREVKGQTSPPL
jgi:hypothetical protein